MISDLVETPSTNRGVQVPKDRVLLDWISFTVFPKQVNRSSAVQILTRLSLRFSDLVDVSGLYFYSEGVGLRDRTIRAMWSSKEPDRGIHIQITGQGCRLLDSLGIDVFEVISQFTCRINCSRLDIAFDVFSGLFDLGDVRRCLERGHYVSRFREGDFHGSGRLGGKINLSPSCLRFGKDSKVRIYDKAEEQDVEYPWVRVEVQGMGDVASAFLSYIFSGLSLHQVLASYLRKNLKFTDCESNKSDRYEILPWWDYILSVAEDLTFALGVVEKTIEEKLEWLKKQVSKTFYQVTDYFMYTEIDIPSVLFEEGKRKFILGGW